MTNNQLMFIAAILVHLSRTIMFITMGPSNRPAVVSHFNELNAHLKSTQDTFLK